MRTNEQPEIIVNIRDIRIAQITWGIWGHSKEKNDLNPNIRAIVKRSKWWYVNFGKYNYGTKTGS